MTSKSGPSTPQRVHRAYINWMNGKANNPSGKPAGPVAIVIFGASGDLTQRKLIPAFANLAQDQLLSEGFSVIGTSRRPMSDEEFRQHVSEGTTNLDPAAWQWLAPRIHYLAGDASDPELYQQLIHRLAQSDREHSTHGNYLFYLSTSPQLFGPIVKQLGQAGLLSANDGSWQRVIVEKPFGHDLASAQQLNQELRQTLREDQLYRIDHYLGKETVQNLLVFRFANGLFEPLWNQKYIDHVQITVAESVGVEERGNYYNAAGALCDMVPNHLFQLLSLVGMEPPAMLEANALRDEQVKLLRAVRQVDPRRDAVRGQYTTSGTGDRRIKAYREERNVSPLSNTETYVGLRLHVDNWRWAGVPFYLRTGKRLATRHSEIVVQFKAAPHLLFHGVGIARCMANQLILSLQPDEQVSIRLSAKLPGPVLRVGSVDLDFDYAEAFGKKPQTGYERLIYECLQGDQTLFQRADMVELGWQIVAPLQQAWQQDAASLQLYPAGSWGPTDAASLIQRDDRHWREDDHCPVLGLPQETA
ncbi:MAG: glucose-6-phosphate dehydrogenase [Gemmatales bacterium]